MKRIVYIILFLLLSFVIFYYIFLPFYRLRKAAEIGYSEKLVTKDYFSGIIKDSVLSDLDLKQVYGNKINSQLSFFDYKSSKLIVWEINEFVNIDSVIFQQSKNLNTREDFIYMTLPSPTEPYLFFKINEQVEFDKQIYFQYDKYSKIITKVSLNKGIGMELRLNEIGFSSSKDYTDYLIGRFGSKKPKNVVTIMFEEKEKFYFFVLYSEKEKLTISDLNNVLLCTII